MRAARAEGGRPSTGVPAEPSSQVIVLPDAESPRADGEGQAWRGSVGLVTLATFVVSGVNYVFALFVVRVLPAAQFSPYAAAQSVLLVLGTGSLAAIPWAVARYMAATDTEQVRREALTFGLTASFVQAVVLAPVVGVVCWQAGGVTLGLVGAAAAFVIGILAGPLGYLQGRDRLLSIVGVRLLETGLRVGIAAVLLVVLVPTATVALLGFPLGTVVALSLGVWLCRESLPGLRPTVAVVRSLLRQSLGSGAIQVALAMLGALDTVYVNAGRFPLDDAGSYQAAAILGRIPLFVSAGIALSSFTAMAAAPSHRDAHRELAHAVRVYAALAVPFVVLCWTVPESLLSLVIPDRYADAQSLLRYTAAAGVMVGLVNVLTTAHQARARYRPCLIVLVAAVAGQALAGLLIGHGGTVTGFALAYALLTAATAAVLSVELARPLHWSLPGLPTPRTLGLLVAGIAVTAAAAGLRGSLVWLVAAAGVVVVGYVAGFGVPGRPRARVAGVAR